MPKLNALYTPEQRAADAEERNKYLNKSELAAAGTPFLVWWVSEQDAHTTPQGQKIDEQWELEVSFNPQFKGGYPTHKPEASLLKRISLAKSPGREKMLTAIYEAVRQEAPDNWVGPMVLVKKGTFFDLEEWDGTIPTAQHEMPF